MTVPALWKMNIIAPHAFVAGNHVEIGPVKDVAHVKLARRIRRRSVYAENGAFLVLPVESINAHLFPFLLPLLLNRENIKFLR